MFDAEGPTVGSKRNNPSGAPASDAGNNTQESKRPRSSAKKVDVLEEMIDKLADKTERMFEMLLTRLNESDAERNAQHATVNTQLLAVNKRIEDLERREVQLQQPWRADVPLSVTNVPTIVNRGNNANATCPGAEGMHGQACSPIPSHDHGYASIVEEQASNRKVRIVEWDKFRKTRDREKKEGPIEDIGAWCKEILADVEKANKEIEWTDWREKEAGAVREVEGHLEGTGLVCAPNKSEILLHRPRKPGRLPKDVAAARQAGVHVTTKEGGRIPTVSKIRVLGLWLEENGANSELVTRLRKKTYLKKQLEALFV
ncbi:hypothetical protein MTO96_043116 [Rhipicephalus appendiculatus]